MSLVGFAGALFGLDMLKYIWVRKLELTIKWTPKQGKIPRHSESQTAAQISSLILFSSSMFVESLLLNL